MFESNHARSWSAGKKRKTLIAVASFIFFASQASADPQSEISAYRKSYGLPAVTVDAKLTELARQQATAMAERGSMDHNVYASFRSRMASDGAAAAAENLAMGTRTFGDTYDGFECESFERVKEGRGETLSSVT